MGKKIDAFVLTAATAICFYLYFYQAMQNHVLAFAAALFCCLIAVKTCKRIARRIRSSSRMQKRRYRRDAAGIIMHLACSTREDALNRLEKLVNKNCQCEHALELIQSHPSSCLSQQTVFEAWRRNRNIEKLVICATCKCEADVRMMASSLEKPQIAIVDSETLKQMIADHPDGFESAPTRKKRKSFHLQRIWQRFLNRKNAPRCLLLGFSSMVMYVFSGNALYLASAMLLLFLALASFHRTPSPAKLF